jgi:hypothetical protein
VGEFAEVRGQSGGRSARRRIYGARWGKGKSGEEGRVPVQPAMAGGWGG